MFVAVDCPAIGTICIDHQPGSQSQRWIGSVSASRSDQAAWDRALRPKLCKLACRPFLSRTVSIKLRQQWSPEQIAGWLKRTYPGELQNQVSHETIYRSLFIQARGVLKKELLEHLRAKRTIRRSKHASLKRNGLGQIKNAVSRKTLERSSFRWLKSDGRLHFRLAHAHRHPE